MEFTVNYWMTDPENGQQNLRSLINLDILKALRANNIEIPYPQRVIHATAIPPAKEPVSEPAEQPAARSDANVTPLVAAASIIK